MVAVSNTGAGGIFFLDHVRGEVTKIFVQWC